MKNSKPLSRYKLKKYLGITPPRKLSRASQEKCDLINVLFNAVASECDVRECKIFEGAYPKDLERAHRELLAFLKDVRKCKNRVLSYAQKLLNENKNKPVV